MKKTEINKINTLGSILADNYVVSHEFNCSPYLHISHKNIYIYGFYEFNEETKEYNTDERELIDTIELTKYDIEDLINNPTDFITNILNNYFYKN